MTAAREPPRPPSLSLNGRAVTPSSASERHRFELKAEALRPEASVPLRARESRTKRPSASSNIACSSVEAKPGSLTCSRLSFENGDRANAWRAVHVRVSHAGTARNLSAPGSAPELQHNFMDLAQPGCTDGLAIRKTSAVGIDGQSTVDTGFSIAQHLLLLAVPAEAVLSHVH